MPPNNHNPNGPGEPDVSKRFGRFEQPSGVSSGRVCSPDYPLSHDAAQTDLKPPILYVRLFRTGITDVHQHAQQLWALLLYLHFSFQISLRELYGDGDHVGIF